MPNKKRGTEDRWFYLAIILLSLFFIFKLYDSSNIISQFPLDQNNDLSSHMGQLQFLKQYGFHQNVPNWYNGYSLFLLYPPGWFFFTLPLYSLFGNILIATYISNILLYLLALAAFCFLRKFAKLSWTKTIFLYLFVFVNPISVGNFIKLGRLPELLSFALFVLFFALLVYYKENKIKWTFLFLSLLYGAILLSHPAFFIVSSFFLPPLFLLKKGKERTWIILMFVIALLLTSFWTIPFFNASKHTELTQDAKYTGLSRLLDFKKEYLFDNFFSFILPVVLWISFFFYCRSLPKKEMKEEIFFYSIPLIFSILFFLRIAAFIPIANQPYPDSYNLFFIFLTALFFIKTSLEKFGRLSMIIKILLVALPFFMIIPSMFFIFPFRANNAIDKQIISVLPEIDGKYLVMNMPYPTSYYAVYSYGAVYYNLSTPNGWYPQTASKELLDKIGTLQQEVTKKAADKEGWTGEKIDWDSIRLKCNNLNSLLEELNVKYIIAGKEYCSKNLICNLNKKVSKEDICLFGR